VIPLRDANPTHRPPVVTIGLIAVCIAVFALELAVRIGDGRPALERLFLDYGLVPADLTGQLGGDQADRLYRELSTLISSTFLHADPLQPGLANGFLHIGFNLLFLWIFGNNIEDRLGHIGFLAFYLAGGIVAGAAQVAADPSSTLPIIGASGAVAAVLGAYLVLYPRARVLSLVYFGLFFQLIRIPAIVLLGIWFGIQVLGAVMASGDSGATGGVALFAHIGGFVAGVVAGILVRGSGIGGRPRALRPSDGIGVG
jgi:membrane associated rhomboid family serine protease